MAFGLLADLVVAVHFAFVVFVVGGGFALLRWPRLAWLHAPAVLWAVWVESAGEICPLTPLESWLLERSGSREHVSSFVEHHLLPLLYPVALTRELQWLLAGAVLAINGVVYTAYVLKSSRGR